MSNVYTVLHHVVDKLGARDETHLHDLHDTITAHELGFDSLEAMREEQRIAAIRVDPQAAADAQKAALALLAQVQSQQQLIQRLLSEAEMARAAQADAARQRAADEARTAAAPNDPFAGTPPPVPGTAPAGPGAAAATRAPFGTPVTIPVEPAADPATVDIAALEAQLNAARAAQHQPTSPAEGKAPAIPIL